VWIGEGIDESAPEAADVQREAADDRTRPRREGKRAATGLLAG
jgi:hypothetical protein